ncbi:MAG: spermidine/putrescine ABC transporter substrate-binding protein [Sphingorhabdus sp.]|jgi:spermidine/putrescine transport system substrate-binding protein|nr:spermidine/putrescine ABC transporter substrate-binding protein [Sphingorhabdus sp.]
MDFKTLLDNAQNRRSLLKGMGVAAVGLTFTGALSGCGEKEAKKLANGEEGKLNFYNWDTYIGETTLEDFKGASGVDVNMTLFASNDELFAKLKAGNQGYDVIVPSNDFVERMAAADMLMPLDHSLIPNFEKNIAPEFKDVPYDPKRKYSMPYTWLALGIGYRKSKVKGVPDSWKALFDSDEYKGRIALLSEAGDMFRLYGKYLGKSVNALTDADIAMIEAMMIKQKPNIKAFHEDNGQDLLLKGEVDLVLEYNGDIAQIMTEDEDIGFAIPKEGSQLNSDNLCIPKGAPRPKNAHAFINYLLDAEAGKKITETILYPTPNAAAKALMPESYKNNPVIFPPADILAKCEYAKYNPDLQPKYEAAFTRVRAA